MKRIQSSFVVKWQRMALFKIAIWIRAVFLSIACTMVVVAICQAAGPTTRAAQQHKWSVVLLQKTSQIKQQVAISGKLLTELRANGLPANEESDAEFLKWLKSTTPADARRYWDLQDNNRRIRAEIVELWLLTLDPACIVNLDYRDLSDPLRANKIVQYYEKLARKHAKEKLPSFLQKNLPKTIQAANSAYAWVALQGIYRWFAIDNRIMVTDADGFKPVTPKTAKQIRQGLHTWYVQTNNDYKWNEKQQQFTKENGDVFHLPFIELHFKGRHYKTDIHNK